MIRSLAIRDLVVIAGAELEPHAGLTAITGETGAGKTVFAQALALLAGGPVDQRAVRPGAKFALVEATIALPGGFWDDLDADDPAAVLRDLVESEDEVVVARRIPAEGRARSMIDGQAAARDSVASLVAALLRFSGQHAQRRLVSPGHQLALLDAFAGPEAATAASALRGLRAELRDSDRALAEVAERRARAAAERDALEMLVADVDAVAPDPSEQASLRAERERLRHAERLAEGIEAACAALGGGEAGGAIGRSGLAAATLAPLGSIVPELGALADRLAAAQDALQEALIELRGQLDGMEASPGRLDDVEDRLAAYQQLERRHGPTVEAAITRAAEARAALATLARGAEEDAALLECRAEILARARAAADALHGLRADAAPAMETSVSAELADLAMPSATLRVEVARDEQEPPADRVTFHLRANPGLPEAPLAESASGGELSRVLLALQTLAAQAEPSATWVFDEVDAGIGGVTATAVAAKLTELARHRQVIVITHLPQVAAVADRHYRLVKEATGEGLARTTIEPVEGEELVDELCRMLGATPGDAGARQHAGELLARRESAPPRRRARSKG